MVVRATALTHPTITVAAQRMASTPSAIVDDPPRGDSGPLSGNERISQASSGPAELPPGFVLSVPRPSTGFGVADYAAALNSLWVDHGSA
jgi:hypothetical protein